MTELTQHPHETDEKFEERKASWGRHDAKALISWDAARLYLKLRHLDRAEGFTVKEVLLAQCTVTPEEAIEVFVTVLQHLKKKEK